MYETLVSNASSQLDLLSDEIQRLTLLSDAYKSEFGENSTVYTGISG